MAIINHSFKFIFVHVPKAAGTSLTSVLAPYTNYCDLEIGGTHFGEQIQPAYKKRFGLTKHSTASEIYSVVGAVTWSQYFSFAFVRNPFSRCLSTYHFLKKWEGLSEDFSKKINQFRDFDEYVLSDTWAESNGPDDIFRPQMHWLKSFNKNEVLVNFVGRVERINEDMKHIAEIIGHSKMKNDWTNIPQLNPSKSIPITEISNTKVIEKIVQKYKIDFEIFNYPIDPQTISNLASSKKKQNKI